MGSRHFRLRVIGHVLLIALALLLCCYCYFRASLYWVTFLLAFLSMGLTWSLIHYVQTTNRQLRRFFNTLKAHTFSDRLPTRHGDSGFRELSIALNRIISTMADSHTEKEQQLRFFQSVLQKMGVGLIALKPNGAIGFINRSARRLLKVPHMNHLRHLGRIDAALADNLIAIESGQRKWINVNDGARRVQLALFAQEIRLPQQGGYKILTLQNLQPELEEKESEAWKDLIRVLSHEIMNSMTPISSLASTVLDLMPAESQDVAANHADLHDAVTAINRRSRRLMQFVQNYRRFASIPAPRREPVMITDLFERLQTLIQNQLAARAITLESRVTPSNLQLYIDPGLIEQVLLNIAANSMDALAQIQDPAIVLAAAADQRARVSIQIKDNGCGMDEALVDKVFIPFFTTKTHGSGIGLSISRQIMRLHGGTAYIHSGLGKGCTVTLNF